LNLGCKKAQIINKVLEDSGKRVLAKDLDNIRAKAKESGENSLKEALKELQQNGKYYGLLRCSLLCVFQY